MPHPPYNRSDPEPGIAAIARTDPNEQESVVLLPELEAGVDWSKAKGRGMMLGADRGKTQPDASRLGAASDATAPSMTLVTLDDA